MSEADVIVIGIGADGWSGLTAQAQRELRMATTIYGSDRQLGLLSGAGAQEISAQLIAWRTPMSTHLIEVIDASHPAPIHLLASGDPMLHGLGSTVVQRIGAARVKVLPTVSSVSLAAARLGWDLATTTVLSTVAADPHALVPELTRGRRLLILSRDGSTPSVVADLLRTNGFDKSVMTVLAQLGGPAEEVISASVEHWSTNGADSLNVIAVDCRGPVRSRLPGLDDAVYDHDGQITKSPMRALTVASLAPGGRQTLWDIGSGSGSVAIEWLRADSEGRAYAFEADRERAARIGRNAARHGVGAALTVGGAFPDSRPQAPAPDTIFIGGGLNPDVLAAAWWDLPPGGRLVANAVTVDTQALLADWHAEKGGQLRRIGIETVAPLGARRTWRPALPIVQWVVTAPDAEPTRSAE